MHVDFFQDDQGVVIFLLVQYSSPIGTCRSHIHFLRFDGKTTTTIPQDIEIIIFYQDLMGRK